MSKYNIMKNILAALFVFISTMAFSAPSDKLINALCKVESGNNAKLIGDNGKAVGVLQIWKCVVDDVNKTSKKKYKHVDRKDPKKSKEICKKYLEMYATVDRLGHVPTNEDYARIWNGGPNGHLKSETKAYWLKVKKHCQN